MRVTGFYKDHGKVKRINFMMRDTFNEKAIRNETRTILKARFPELVGRIDRYEWRY